MHNSLFYDKIIATHFFNERLKGTIMKPTRILLIHTAVSYTHLDVYKRQVQIDAFHIPDLGHIRKRHIDGSQLLSLV